MAGSSRPRIPRKKSKDKYVAAAVLIVLITLLAVGLAYYYWPRPKRAATEYLSFVHTRSTGTFYNNNQTVSLHNFGLNITAVGGDATSIIIQMDSQANIEDDVYTNITKGATLPVVIVLQGYQTTLQNINGTDVFPVEFRAGSAETDFADITFYIRPSEITRMGGP